MSDPSPEKFWTKPMPRFGEFLRTVLLSCPESSPDTEVDVLVLCCLRYRNAHFHRRSDSVFVVGEYPRP